MSSISNPSSNLISDQSVLNIEVFSIFASLSEEIQKLLSYANESHFICKECKSIPLLQFQNLSKFFVSCECSRYVQLNIRDLWKKFIIDKEEYDNIPEIEINLKCNEHKKNYKYYCLNHNINLCEVCQKIHNCDNIKNFEEEKYNLDKDIIPFIANSLINKSININDFDDNQIINTDSEYLTNLISILLNNYYCNPDYITIINIKNFYSKLRSIDESEKDKYEIENNIKITTLKQYKKVNYQQKKDIKRIYIFSKNFDVSNLNNEKLINLIELSLSSNNISNIEPLTTAVFNNLQNLNLSINRLDDSMIEVISKLNFNDLLSLDLSYDYFTHFNYLS